jgi:N-acetylglucosamine malate deacetylase 1
MMYERVLAIGAHTDDIELGCAGLLSRLRREGSEIKVVVFSRAEESLPEGAAADTLERECNKSMAHLGLGAPSLIVKRIPVRRFLEFRQSILDDLFAIKKQFEPLLVLTVSGRDTHQDHQVIHNESVRAFRSATILAYEIPWNQLETSTQLFVELTAEDLDIKSAMIAEYKSQSSLGRRYMDGNYAQTAALFRGYQSKMALVEAYEVITMRWPL